MLRQHLLEGISVPQICEENDLHPTIFYRWQRELFRRAHIAFQRQSSAALAGGHQQKVRDLRMRLRSQDRKLAALGRQTDNGAGDSTN